MTASLQGYFISATDTGVGKTYISRQLIHQLNQLHDNVKVRKPVESGCHRNDDDQLEPSDGMALFTANQQRESLDIVTPYRFSAALAPNQAARLEGHKISVNSLETAVRKQLTSNDVVLVEGAGGIYSPIADDGFNIDLAAHLGLKLILIVDDRLGAINQALTAWHAIEQKGLDLFCIILNQPAPFNDGLLNNLSELPQYVSCPVYHCPYQGTLSGQIFQTL